MSSENLKGKALVGFFNHVAVKSTIAVVAVGLVGATVYSPFSTEYDTTEPTTETAKPVFDLAEDAGSELGGLEKADVVAALNQQVADSMMNISMNSSPIFEDGVGNLLIVNKETNNKPQVVEIYTEDDMLIYQSGAISVGSKVETGSLLVDLEEGTYPCTAYFNALNPETGELAGRAGINIKVTVQ